MPKKPSNRVTRSFVIGKDVSDAIDRLVEKSRNKSASSIVDDLLAAALLGEQASDPDTDKPKKGKGDK